MGRVSRRGGDISFFHVDPSKRGKFPKRFSVIIGCRFARRGRLGVFCEKHSSTTAITGVAGRSCFGLGKRNDKSILSRRMYVRTGCFAPMGSDRSVPANRCTPITKAPVSFGISGPVNESVRTSFRRLGFANNCSRGCMASGCTGNGIHSVTATCYERSNVNVRISSSYPYIRFCTNGFIGSRGKGGNRICRRHCKFYLRARIRPGTIGIRSFRSPVLLPNRRCDSRAICHFFIGWRAGEGGENTEERYECI